RLDLRDFVSLEELNCGGNRLIELDVSGCSKLTKLSCHSNLLTSLELTHNPALEILDCHFNNLTTLSLTENSDLEEVNVGLNKITADLNIFSHLVYLKVLILGYELENPETKILCEKNQFFGSLKSLENCQYL